MIPGSVKHWDLVQVPQCAYAVVRCCGANEDAHVAASNRLLGEAGIFQSFVCALQKLPLLGIFMLVLVCR